MLRTIVLLTFPLLLTAWAYAQQPSSVQQAAAEPQERFDIDVMVILSDAEIAGIDRSLRINKLKLTGPRVTNAALGDLPELASINLLSIESTQITNAGLELLQPAKLRSLRLWQRSFDDSALKQVKKLSRLEFLDLEGTEAGGAELAQLQDLTKLQTLVLGSATDDAQIAALRDFSSLKELDLRGCRNLSDEGVLQLQGLVNLQVLWLPRQVTEQGELRLLQKLPKCKMLR
jgi:F-box and leucine-rich repeat protein 14